MPSGSRGGGGAAMIEEGCLLACCTEVGGRLAAIEQRGIAYMTLGFGGWVRWARKSRILAVCARFGTRTGAAGLSVCLSVLSMPSTGAAMTGRTVLYKAAWAIWLAAEWPWLASTRERMRRRMDSRAVGDGAKACGDGGGRRGHEDHAARGRRVQQSSSNAGLDCTPDRGCVFPRKRCWPAIM